jgi:chromosome partitioning protein
MPKIITISHQKGGVGKSTIAVNLAHAFKDNTTTAIVDLDQQGSITESKSKISGIDVLPYLGGLAKLNYGAVFVDTPPYLSDKLPAIYEQSDLILIPTKAGIYDVIACRKTVILVQEAMKHNKKLKAAILLNMVNSSTTLTDEAREELATYKLPILKTIITERVNFVRSVALPDGIYSTNDRKAIDELNNLTKEVLFLLQ